MIGGKTTSSASIKFLLEKGNKLGRKIRFPMLGLGSDPTIISREPPDLSFSRIPPFSKGIEGEDPTTPEAPEA